MSKTQVQVKSRFGLAVFICMFGLVLFLFGVVYLTLLKFKTFKTSQDKIRSLSFAEK